MDQQPDLSINRDSSEANFSSEEESCIPNSELVKDELEEELEAHQGPHPAPDSEPPAPESQSSIPNPPISPPSPFECHRQ